MLGKKEMKKLKEKEKDRPGSSKHGNKRKRLFGQELLEVPLEMLICPGEMT